MSRYRDNYAQFGANNAAVFGVSVDSTWSNMAFRQQMGLDFPLLSDVVVGPAGFSFQGVAQAPADELRSALGGLLVEFLSVVELVAGDILLPALQTELLRVGKSEG